MHEPHAQAAIDKHSIRCKSVIALLIVKWTRLAAPVAVPDIAWTVQRKDGNAWVLDFFWQTRAQASRAEDVCRLQRGHLVTIDSLETSQMLIDKVTSDETGRPPFPFVHALTILWIGLHSETPSNSRSGPW
jgi:hypothetical protein